MNYGELFMASPSGLRVYAQTSNENVPPSFVDALTASAQFYRSTVKPSELPPWTFSK
jgi:hypothetical protein